MEPLLKFHTLVGEEQACGTPPMVKSNSVSPDHRRVWLALGVFSSIGEVHYVDEVTFVGAAWLVAPLPAIL